MQEHRESFGSTISTRKLAKRLQRIIAINKVKVSFAPAGELAANAWTLHVVVFQDFSRYVRCGQNGCRQTLSDQKQRMQNSW